MTSLTDLARTVGPGASSSARPGIVRSATMSFGHMSKINKVVEQVKEKLRAQNMNSVTAMFQSIDKDRSSSLSTEEFAAALKGFGIVLPPHDLALLVAQFDANGDGSVSIPEFTTFMQGQMDTFDSLKAAPAMRAGEAEQKATAPHGSLAVRSSRKEQLMGANRDKPMTVKDFEFLSRMTSDIDTRRRDNFINELKKDPRFKPSMLEPPKPKFKEVTLTGGPIVKMHKAGKTGLETKKPYQWGPLGGFY